MTEGQDSTHEAVEQAIQGALSDTGEMVTKWLACVETFDQDGNRCLWLLSNTDAKAWDNLGMLAYATQCEQARTTASYLAEDD